MRRATQARAIQHLCRQTSSLNQALLANAHPQVAGVLREAGPTPINLVALEILLRGAQHHDLQVVRDLFEGFPPGGPHASAE